MSALEAAGARTAPPLSYALASGRFYRYRFVSRLSFHVPLVTLAFLSLPLIVVGALVAFYGLASSFSTPLATASARRVGLARTMALGEAAKGVGALGLGLLVTWPPSSPLLFAVAAAASQGVGGLGYALAAVPDGVLAGAVRTLPDAASDAATSDARAASAMFAAFMLAGLVGAALAQWIFPLPFFLGAAASIAGAAAALGLVALDAPRGGPTAAPAAAAALPPGARDAVLVYGLYRGVSLSVQVAIMPLVLFVQRQMPLWLFGVAFAAYTLAGYLSAKHHGRLLGPRSSRIQAAAIGGLSAMALAGLALAPGLWIALAPIPLFVAAGFVRPFCLPLLSAGKVDAAVRQRRIATAERSFAVVSAGCTLLAYASFAGGLPLSAFLGALGGLLAAVSLKLALSA